MCIPTNPTLTIHNQHMAKYSVNSSDDTNSSDSSACELCGTNGEHVSEQTVAGATIMICSQCGSDTSTQQNSQQSRDNTESPRSSSTSKDTINTATSQESSLWNRDTSRWETEGVEYTNDRLPRLLANYGSIVREARVEKGLTREELAERAQTDEITIVIIEQGSAVSKNVGGEVVENVEQELQITITEEAD